MLKGTGRSPGPVLIIVPQAFYYAKGGFGVQPYRNNPVSRRSFLWTGTGFLVSAALAKADTLTAQQVIERIQKNVGVPWRTTTVDTIKAGSADTPVKGIATTMVATLDLLKRASAANRNLVIVHEPTFYNGNADELQTPGNADDPDGPIEARLH